MRRDERLSAQRRDRYQHVAERRRSVPHRIGAL
ncbi:hypothetical protein PC116_g25065 [Phytophthora cactorum]|nr:hypothetical protein PC114_g21570 [Phytophthora cactorum]KAG3027797.1 hypothetical protein PC120_g5229 [Phytophthora cactorum]KAG3149990.1 hypothetical protein C6341_g16896 [Phytophthora cactorum]KAG3179614.1 hypothetical protein PC128_g15850 [Phytophthora cactorum]KAG4226530.1 hypothetical protein PC116_g25065 [Phytophthora cactorum]